MPSALIAKCRDIRCLQRVTCAHFREETTDPDVPEIVGPSPGRSCSNYFKIGLRAGRALTPWTRTESQRTHEIGGDDPFARRYGPARKKKATAPCPT